MTLPDQGTTDRITAKLKELRLHALAARAATGEFSDYSSPHVSPQHVLVAELRRVIRWRTVENLQGVADMVRDVIAGVYDSTSEESAAWQASPDGQAAMRDLGPDGMAALEGMMKAWKDKGK